MHIVVDLFLIPVFLWMIFGLMRMGCSPEYKRYKKEHPGHWL